MLILSLIAWSSVLMANPNYTTSISFRDCEVPAKEQGYYLKTEMADILYTVKKPFYTQGVPLINIATNNLGSIFHAVGDGTLHSNTDKNLVMEGPICEGRLTCNSNPSNRLYYEEKSDGTKFFKLSYVVEEKRVVEIFDTTGNYLRLESTGAPTEAGYVITEICGSGFGKTLPAAASKASLDSLQLGR